MLFRSTGKALDKLADFIEAQGGERSQVYHPETLPCAQNIIPILSTKQGYIQHIDCDEIGICSLMLGGGRETKESIIDLSVGIILEKKVGDYVSANDIIAYIHTNNMNNIEGIQSKFLNAYHYNDQPILKRDLISHIIL